MSPKKQPALRFDAAPDKAIALRKEVINWMAQYLEHSEYQGFVLGMSGGVDSSTLAMLARDAALIYKKNVLALMLPIEDSEMEVQHVKDQCNRFEIRLEVAPLQAAFGALKHSLPITQRSVIDTNLKARLRECALYYHSNINNYLVLSTVNSGEFSTGYFPKHGVAGDLMPFATLLKQEIREIARTYGLPEKVVMAKASGCVVGRTAEEEWGFSEDELDEFSQAIECGEDAVWSLKGISRDNKDRFLTMHRNSHHKRTGFPVFRRASSR